VTDDIIVATMSMMSLHSIVSLVPILPLESGNQLGWDW